MLKVDKEPLFLRVYIQNTHSLVFKEMVFYQECTLMEVLDSSETLLKVIADSA